MIHPHQGRLNEIAKQHGLRPLSGTFDPKTYLGYAMDLALVGLGLLKPEEIVRPLDVHEEYAQRTAAATPATMNDSAREILGALRGLFKK